AWARRRTATAGRARPAPRISDCVPGRERARAPAGGRQPPRRFHCCSPTPPLVRFLRRSSGAPPGAVKHAVLRRNERSALQPDVARPVPDGLPAFVDELGDGGV